MQSWHFDDKIVSQGFVSLKRASLDEIVLLKECATYNVTDSFNIKQ